LCELEDAHDSKSCARRQKTAQVCGYDSHLRHLF
jgi:hypothetical protein